MTSDDTMCQFISDLVLNVFETEPKLPSGLDRAAGIVI